MLKNTDTRSTTRPQAKRRESLFESSVPLRELRAVRRALMAAHEDAKLAYQFAPNSYTHSALAQIELALEWLAQMPLEEI